MKLEVNGLAKAIGTKPVLRRIDFNLQVGEIVGLVGRNGAGKSTLMRVLAGQYQGGDANIALDGVSFETNLSLRQQVIYVDETQGFFEHLSVGMLGSYYEAGYSSFDAEEYARLIEHFHLKKSDQFSELSKGQRALVTLAITLASRVPFMLLDEPFDGLDVFVRERIVRAVIDAVATGQRGALVASHNLVELDGIADQILFLKDGVISQTADLETAREQVAKFQLVFKQATIPDIVRVSGRVIDIQGRVMTVLFNGYDESLKRGLEAENPVLMERLPLSLTDLFKGEHAMEVNDD